VATGHVLGPLRSTRLHAAGIIAPDAVVAATDNGSSRADDGGETGFNSANTSQEHVLNLVELG
jgi:hypothetical protein